MEDVNDHDPTFTQSIYNFNVRENDDTPDNVTVHTPVGQVNATDLDLTKTDLSYRIVTSDVGHIFNVTQVCFVFCIFFSPTVNCLFSVDTRHKKLLIYKTTHNARNLTCNNQSILLPFDKKCSIFNQHLFILVQNVHEYDL